MQCLFLVWKDTPVLLSPYQMILLLIFSISTTIMAIHRQWAELLGHTAFQTTQISKYNTKRHISEMKCLYVISKPNNHIRWQLRLFLAQTYHSRSYLRERARRLLT